MTNTTLRIAAFQRHPVFDEPETSLAQLQADLRWCRDEDLELARFPEAYLQRYSSNALTIASVGTISVSVIVRMSAVTIIFLEKIVPPIFRASTVISDLSCVRLRCANRTYAGLHKQWRWMPDRVRHDGFESVYINHAILARKLFCSAA
jgi:hypothetical protein